MDNFDEWCNKLVDDCFCLVLYFSDCIILFDVRLVELEEEKILNKMKRVFNY